MANLQYERASSRVGNLARGIKMGTGYREKIRKIGLVAAAALIASGALAQTVTTITDQNPAPAPSQTTNAELVTQSITVPGGLLYVSTLAQSRYNGGNGQPQSVSSVFVPTSVGGRVRYFNLTGAVDNTGVPLTATATGGNMGVSRTEGTSLVLVGEATSASAKTDEAHWEFNVADSFVANSVLPITVNANYTGAGTITAASTTISIKAYTEVNGVETAITGITAAQQFTGTATSYVFNIPTSAALTPGQHIMLDVVMLVTSSAGANTGQVNSVSATM